MRAGTFAAAGVVGLGLLGVVILAGPLWQPGYDAVRRYGSELALGDNGWLMTAAFVAGGGGCASLAIALWRSLEPSRRRTAGVMLLVLVAIGLAASAAVPTGAHRPGAHEFIGLASFVAVVIALPLLGASMSTDTRLGALSGPARLAAVLSLLVMIVIALFASPGGDAAPRPLDPYAGLLQKLSIAPWLTWLLVVGYRIARPDPTTVPEAQST